MRCLGDKHHLRKSAGSKAPISLVNRTWVAPFLTCALQSADIGRSRCLSPEHNFTNNLFCYFQWFLVLIWFIFSMGRRAVLFRKLTLFPRQAIGLRGSTDDYQVCVAMVTLKRWADVGLWVAVCVLGKISLRRPTTTVCTFWYSHRQSRSQKRFRIRSIRDANKFTSFLFRNSFLPIFLLWWSNDFLVEDLQVAGG